LGTTKDDKCNKLGLYKLYDFTKAPAPVLLTNAWDFTPPNQNRESGPW